MGYSVCETAAYKTTAMRHAAYRATCSASTQYIGWPSPGRQDDGQIAFAYLGRGSWYFGVVQAYLDTPYIFHRKISMNSSASVEAFGLGCASQMPLHFTITYHRYGARAHQHHTLATLSQTSYSYHQPDHVAFQQQHRSPSSAIV